MKRRLVYCGVDPGKATGLFGVTIEVHDDEVTTSVHPAEVPPDLVISWLESWLDLEPQTVIACERYIISRRTARLSRQYDALEIIGKVRELSLKREVVMISRPKGNVAKLASDRRLRAIGWYSRGMGHANDAARHVLHLISSRELTIFDLLLRDVI